MKEINGYTRVTEILSFFQDLSKIPKEILDAKAELGTRVHEAIEAHNNSEFIAFSDDVEGYLNSFFKWINQTDAAIRINKERFYSDDLKITGEVDAIALLYGKLFIVDYKTSYKPNHKIWPLQGTFYWMLAKDNFKDLEKRVLFLQLLKNGELAQSHFYNIDDKMVALCESLVTTYRYFVQ